MTVTRLVPPLDYMRAASRTSLQSFELARLNHAANLRREIAALIDQWIQERSEATMARWILDHQESFRASQPAPADTLSTFPELEVDLFPDLLAPSARIVQSSPHPSGERIARKSDK
jgi:hypothetical protein